MPSMRRLLLIVVLTSLSMELACNSSFAQSTSPGIRLVSNETSIAMLPPGIGIGGLAVSPDGKRIGYTATSSRIKKGKFVLLMGLTLLLPNANIVDGVPRTRKGRVVVDGVVGKLYAEVSTPVFSTDSKHTAYVARQGEASMIVMDGVEGEQYAEVGELRFLSGDRRVAFAVRRGNNWRLVIDDLAGKPYQFVWNLTPSPDGNRIAYAVLRDDKFYVVVDGIEGRGYREVGRISFSPDGNHVAYLALRNQKWIAVLDGEEKIEMNGLPFYSWNGKRLAYVTLQDKKWQVVVDSVGGSPYDRISDWIAFSPDSSRVVYGAKRKGAWVLVADGVEIQGGTFDDIAPRSLGFSPDGKHVVCAARRGSKWFMIVDGVVGASFDSILSMQPTFDGASRFKFVGSKDKELLLVETEIHSL